MTLIIALISLVLLSALGTSLAVVMNTEQRVAANYAASREAKYAADGALQIAARELLAVADWNALLSSGALSGFVDGAPSGLRQLGDGSSVDLARATSFANAEPRPWGANNPLWRLFGFGWLGPKTYVIAWVGDDFAENDGDPSTDGAGPANPGAGILAVRAEAFGVRGAHTVLEATVRRDMLGPGGPIVQVLSWQEIK
ncbi:MAG: pilus assembly PilX N-terminal domain-containing protein [Vicinamibacterales bacterium]